MQTLKTVRRYTDTNYELVGVILKGYFRETEGMPVGQEVQLRNPHGSWDWSPDGEVWYELPSTPNEHLTSQPS
jgi:hypothetical protein